MRWNCKAGKCGSCSAEINGRPRLMCMTRMSTFADDEVVTVTPLRTFPVIRDLVTDVGFNYTKAREVPSFAPPPELAPGEYRMQQVDVERSQEFRKCIECYLCQNTCHVVRDHEENKQAFSGPRYLMRVAELEMHPLDVADRRRDRPGRPRAGLLQHHQVLHRGLPGAHQDHRQRAHPAQGARGRPQVRPARLARQQDLQALRRVARVVVERSRCRAGPARSRRRLTRAAVRARIAVPSPVEAPRTAQPVERAATAARGTPRTSAERRRCTLGHAARNLRVVSGQRDAGQNEPLGGRSPGPLIVPPGPPREPLVPHGVRWETQEKQAPIGRPWM